MVTFHGCVTQFLVRLNFSQFLQLHFLVDSVVKLIPRLLHPALRMMGHRV